MNLSAHRVTTYMHSERCAFWRYGLRLRRTEEAASLRRGSELHAQAANWVRGMITDSDLILLGFGESLKRTLGPQEENIYDIEQEFTIPLRPGAAWLGILDLVVKADDGLLYITDYKFPNKRCDTSYYAGPVSNSLQMTGYYWLGKSFLGD